MTQNSTWISKTEGFFHYCIFSFRPLYSIFTFKLDGTIHLAEIKTDFFRRFEEAKGEKIDEIGEKD